MELTFHIICKYDPQVKNGLTILTLKNVLKVQLKFGEKSMNNMPFLT